MSIIDGLLFSWQKNSDYAARLVSDLSDEQMMLQPAPEGKAAANHPAWILSHLNVYLPVIASVIQGENFDDPKSNQFGMDSKPEADPSIYASKDTLINEFVAGHENGHLLLHENGHLGQLSAWRRIQGMPSV